MAEDGVMPKGEKPEHGPSEEEIGRMYDEFLVAFCEEKGWNPKTLDATQLSTVFEQPRMQAILALKHPRRR